MASYEAQGLPYFGAMMERPLELQMATPALNQHFIPLPASLGPPLQATPISHATHVSSPPNPQRSATPNSTPPPPSSSPLPLSASIPAKPKKPWTEAERSALKDAVIKYRTRKNQHKLPWKQILSDPLYFAYRVERSKDAIMQHWKTLKKEVNQLPAPEPVEEEVEASDATDSDASNSSRGSSNVRPALKPRSAAKVKWTDEDTAVLDEAIAQYGQDWRKILADDSFRQRLKNRNPVSLGKNFHRFHPKGIAQKAQALEEKRLRKEAKEEKAALQELSATSEDESDDDSPPPRHGNGASHASHGKGESTSASASAKRRRESSDASGSSESEGSDGSSTSNASTDDESGATSPSLLSSPVDAPIQSWEKPDARDVANFRRCRHVCGCKSLTSEGREFINQQAVMVRGSRRNHEVNQRLHPHCRSLHRPCERLLGPLKEPGTGTGKHPTGRKRRRTAEDAAELSDDDGDDDHSMDADTDDAPPDVKADVKRRHRHDNRDALNGGHAGDNSVVLSPPAKRSSAAGLSTAESPAGGAGRGAERGEGQMPAGVRGLVERTMAQIDDFVSSLKAELTGALLSSAVTAPMPSPSTVHSYAERYEKLLERTGEQDVEIHRLRSNIAALEQQLQPPQLEPAAPQPSASPAVKAEAAVEATGSAV